MGEGEDVPYAQPHGAKQKGSNAMGITANILRCSTSRARLRPLFKTESCEEGSQKSPSRVPMQGSDSRGSLEDRACFASAAQGSGFVMLPLLPPAPCCCWHADISKSAPAPLLSCGQTAPPGWADTVLHGAHPSAGTALSLLPGTAADRGGKSSGAVGKQGRDRQTGMAVSL